MNKTTFYQLNQWEPADQVRRTDFNEDNAKIDAALAAVPYVKLLEVVTTEAKTQIDLDVSQFDLTKFQKLEVHVIAQVNAGNSIGLGLRLNNHAADYFSNYNLSTKGDSTGMSSITLTSNPGGGHYTLYFFGPHIMCVPYGTSWNDSTVYFTHNSATSIRSSVISTGDLHTINLFTSSAGRYLMPGARVVVTGLKL